MNDTETLTYVAETNGLTAWVHNETGNVLELRSDGVYYLSSHERRYDYVVVLGHLSSAETSRLLETPDSEESRRVALDLLETLQTNTARSR